ncbi:GNAT family N-acetyltransferase [Phycicoccus sp. CSK15P-2]|uniref:GNAT family N-acetyltransferase n=1 Tax=Phycicoccus sp. CSK15P-2 TaxID=2807627 RepID=UPI00194DE80C|nr:GNAT family protein [Phycicoccus sp. CSK15P-2]MBM6405461.1 GNAT family N-acetyltransferase [Phycicoccus sp. CSK15P-2]
MPAHDLATEPTLVGELVELRPFTGADAPRMAQILSDPEVRRLTGSVDTSAEAEQAQPVDDHLVRWYTTRAEQPDRLDLALVDRATGVVQGEVVLNEYDDDGRVANLRCLVGPDGRDRGLGTEAVRLVCDYALEVAGLERLTLEVFEFNPRARRVYEKVGFVQTGTRLEALVFDGVAVAAVDMELTRRSGSAASR